jgi:hypothetical protein
LRQSSREASKSVTSKKATAGSAAYRFVVLDRYETRDTAWSIQEDPTKSGGVSS